jgi:hypothetical protein
MVGGPCLAGGVRTFSLSEIPVTDHALKVDGRLGDWPSTPALVYNPLVLSVDAGNSKLVQMLRDHPHCATVRACYDAQNLYVAVEWQGAFRLPGYHAALALHLSTDRITHVELTPIAIGKQAAISVRYGQNVSGVNGRALGADSEASFVPASGTLVQEIKLPWKLITKSGVQPQTPDFQFMADFSWSDLGDQTIANMPVAVLYRNTFVQQSFLTSPQQIFNWNGYLGNTADWGDLDFSPAAAANSGQSSPMVTGMSTLTANAASKPPVVDGDLSDWDATSFQDIALAPGFLGNRYSAKIATRYDNTALYVAAKVHNPAGLYNLMPQSSLAGYSGGDCLQIRLSNGSKTVNLCGWYDSKTGSPALTADSNNVAANPVLLQTGASEGFRKISGEGYTQEIAIPWKSIGFDPPAPGSAWKATFQFWWAGINPEFSALVNTRLAPRPVVSTKYRIPVEANVTLGVFDAHGKLLRSIIKNAHRDAGTNSEPWDGIDQWGKPLAPGTYTVKGIYYPPIGLDYVTSIGNPGTPPWPTPDGSGDWISDEAAPQAAATDGTNVYLAAPGSEKGFSIIGVGPDGKRIWGTKESINPRSVALAVSGQYLYALYSGPELTDSTSRYNGTNATGRALLLCLDKTTGTAAQFSTQSPNLRVASWPYVDNTSGIWTQRVGKSFSAANYGGQPRYFGNDLGEPTDALGITASAGRLYISLYSQNQILVLDAVTARQTDTISLPHPAGLFALPSGKILAVSDNSVVSVDPASKTASPVIGTDLDSPHDVTAGTDGTIYVSDWGASFQVKEFAPDGKFVRAIGKPGGRPWIGDWDQSGMLLPRGMAVTKSGELWVAEDDAAPNRVSVWNSATGSFVRDYIGPAPYGGGGNFWVDPKDSSTVLAEGTLFHVDYASKTWKPISTPFRRMSADDPFSPNGMTGLPDQHTLIHDGHEYIFLCHEQETVVLMRDGNRLKPVAAIGSRQRERTRDGSQEAIWDSDIGTHMISGYFPPCFKGHAGDNYVWTDSNGDGLVQADEMQWSPTINRFQPHVDGFQPELAMNWGSGIGPDGAIYMYGQNHEVYKVVKYPITSWTSTGVPRYDIAQGKTVVDNTTSIEGLYVDSQNHLYVTHSYEWRTNDNPDPSVACYDQNGVLLWQCVLPPRGKQQPDDVEADNIVGEFDIPGLGPVLGTWLWHANYKPYLFTADGLYVSPLLDDTVLGPKATWDESYKNYFQGTDGTPYLVNGGVDAFHILKITGLNNIHRFTFAMQITPSQSSAALLAQSAPAAAKIAPLGQPVIHVAWPAAPLVPGTANDNESAVGGVALTGTLGRSAHVRLARDKQNLYLAFDVQGAKLANGGSDWRTLFLTGDCCDLMLSTGENRNKVHFSSEVGDERLLLSVFQGKPVAVLYRPVVPGTTASVRLMGATVDQITRLASATVSFKRNTNSYTLQATVPLADLGIPTDFSDELRGDVGVIYADATGANRALRLYYNNKHTSVVSDLTTEATLQPGEWGAIEFPLGQNLVVDSNFANPLVTDRESGWFVSQARNGGTASIDAASPSYTGTNSLLLQSVTPVTFAEADYNLPDYGRFIDSANGGKGGSYVEVQQEVPVTSGKKYSFRFHYRSENMQGEQKNPGPVRGYTSLNTGVDFIGGSHNSGIWVSNIQWDTPAWTTLLNKRFNNYDVPTPYVAPDGATKAVIHFALVDNAAKKLPKIYIDDVEFAESPQP